MAISVDWDNKIVFIPKADMLLVQSSPTEIRELDINLFRLELKSLEGSEEGMPFLDIHSHTPPVSVGGVTLARVVEIINGYTITFEDEQYAVNLVGANSNIGDSVNVNQVSVRSANSAGLTYSKEIEDQSFEEARIWIDVDAGESGTQFPRGTPQNPVNNYLDAITIANNRGFTKRFHLHGELLINSGYNISHSDWNGSGSQLSSIIISGNDLNSSAFNNCTITGSMINTGECIINNGGLIDMDGWRGSVRSSEIGGNVILLSGQSSGNYNFIDCYSRGGNDPTIDCNNVSNLEMHLIRYSGNIKIKNFSNSNNILSIDLISGEVILDSSITSGIIIVRGTGSLINNSSGTTTVIDNLTPVWSESEKDSTLTALTSIADIVTLLQKYEENRTIIDPLNNTLTIYDDDDVTPILTFSLLDTTGTPSTSEVAEKVPL